MLFRLADHRNDQSWAAHLRSQRFAFFRSLVQRLPDQRLRILDVGGRPEFWLREVSDASWQVTLLNLDGDTSRLPPWMTQQIGDARALPWPDRSFDVVFSNSVIEHVGGPDDQRRVAEEVRRVGQRYFVQTPNFYFPIEPHFLVPGFQFLPLSIRAWLLTQRRLGWMAQQPVYADALAEVRQIRLLTASELHRLFPQAQLYRERIGWLVKSFVAYEGWPSGSA